MCQPRTHRLTFHSAFVLFPGGSESVLEFCLHSVTRLTGSTVTRIVASRATISDMKARLIMMSHSFFVGVHSSGIDAFPSPLASTSTAILCFCMSSGVTGRTVTAVACLRTSSLSLSPTVQALVCVHKPLQQRCTYLFLRLNRRMLITSCSQAHRWVLKHALLMRTRRLSLSVAEILLHFQWELP